MPATLPPLVDQEIKPRLGTQRPLQWAWRYLNKPLLDLLLRAVATRRLQKRRA